MFRCWSGSGSWFYFGSKLASVVKSGCPSAREKTMTLQYEKIRSSKYQSCLMAQFSHELQISDMGLKFWAENY